MTDLGWAICAVAGGVALLAVLVAGITANLYADESHRLRSRLESANERADRYSRYNDEAREQRAWWEGAAYHLYSQLHGCDSGKAAAALRGLSVKAPAHLQLPPPCPKPSKKGVK